MELVSPNGKMLSCAVSRVVRVSRGYNFQNVSSSNQHYVLSTALAYRTRCSYAPLKLLTRKERVIKFKNQRLESDLVDLLTSTQERPDPSEMDFSCC